MQFCCDSNTNGILLVFTTGSKIKREFTLSANYHSVENGKIYFGRKRVPHPNVHGVYHKPNSLYVGLKMLNNL